MSHLELKNVSRNFGGLRALSKVSFDVRRGEMLGIMGANGAGKTTLFNVITGHIPPSSGEITLDGKRLTGLRPDQVCRQGVGRTFQIVKPFPNFTVMENLLTAAMFGAAGIQGKAAAHEHCRRVLEDMGMTRQADYPARELTLSGQKRLELARAVCTGAEIVMLDEVMAGLTPTEVADMSNTIARLHQKRKLTVLIIEHVMKALMNLSERIVVLHHGEVIATGTPDEIGKHPKVHEVYFGESR